MVYMTCKGILGDKFAAKCVVESLFGVKMPPLDKHGHLNAYVDHQSSWALPNNWDGRGLNIEFVRDLEKYILTSGIVICGGDDNVDEYCPLLDMGSCADPPGLNNLAEQWGSLVARKDGDWWVLFNRKTGTKIRINLVPYPDAQHDNYPIYEKATWPELVDLKITDRCERGCPYCYQGSTAEGQHANFDNIFQLLRRLGEMHVFEIAIGGGEPTLHPHFVSILESAAHQGIVANFSTGSLDWMTAEDPIVLWLREHPGRVAFSPLSNWEICKFAEAGCHAKLPKGKLAVHVVLGSPYAEYCIRDAERMGLDVVLLGWKPEGRAQGKEPRDYSDWMDWVRKADLQHVSIDTVVAQEFSVQLAKVVPDVCITTLEGKFSMYMDAVANKMGPSSYCDAAEMVAIPDTCEEIAEQFAKW